MARIPNREELPDFLSKLEEEAKRWMSGFSDKWDKFADVMRNQRQTRGVAAPLFRAPLTIPAILRKASLLVETKPSFDIKPRKNGFQKTSEILKHIIMAGWDEQSLQMELEMLALCVETFGCAFWAVEYDDDSNYGEGGVCVRSIDPRLMKVDPAITKAIDLCKAQYVIEEGIVPLIWIQQKYPKVADKVDADNSLNLTSFMSEETTHKLSWYHRIMGKMTKQEVDAGAIPRCLLKRFWIADEESDYGYRRILQTGDGTILNPDKKDQENPYWDKYHPYEMIDSESDLDAPFGHSEVERLAKIDEPFNRLANLLTRNALRNVPWVIADANALDPDVIQDLLEREEVVVQKAAGRSVERTPPVTPTAVDMQFLELMHNLVDEFTGVKEGGMPGGGKGRVEVRSEPQVQGLQTQGMTLVRAQARRMEAFMERFGQKWISRIFQFVPDDQILCYVDQGELKTFEIQKQMLMKEIVQDAHSVAAANQAKYINEEMEEGRKLSEKLLNEAGEPYADADEILEATKQAWRKFRFKIVPLSTLMSVKMQRAALLEQLAQQGRIPGSMVVREAGLDNPEELQKLALEEMKQRQALGFPPPDAGKGKSKSKK